MQPFQNASSVFTGDVESYEYVFSIAMWMALIYAAIFAGIVGLGVAMLASIQTPTRLDDPKLDKVLSVPSE